MSKVVVAVTELSSKEKWDKFTSLMIGGFTKLKFDGFKCGKNDVTFFTRAYQVENLNASDYDVFVGTEEVDGYRLGIGRLNKWRKENPDLKIILIVDDDRKMSAKLNSLFNLGYYNILYRSDYVWGKIKELIVSGRTKEDAYIYYGLENFVQNDGKGKSPDASMVSKMTVKVTAKGSVAKETVKAVEPRHKGEKKSENDSVKPPVGKKESSKGKSPSDSQKAVKKAAIDKSDDNKKPLAKKSDAKAAALDKNEVSAKAKDKKDAKKTQKDAKERAKASNKDTADVVLDLPKGKKSAKTEQNDISSGNEHKKKEVKEPAAGQEVKKTVRVKAAEVIDDKAVADRSDLKAVSVPSDSKAADKGTDKKNKKAPVDDAALYDTDDDYDEIDTSEYLVPTMDEEVLDDVNWMEATEADSVAFIRQMEDRSYHPIEITMELGLEDSILEELLQIYTRLEPIHISNLESGLLDRAMFEQDLMQRIEGYPDLNEEQKRYIFESFTMFMFGYDILTPFIEDPSVSDIALVDYNNIQIKRYGQRYFSRIIFRSREHFDALVSHIVKMNHVDLSDKKPNKTFMDVNPDAARLRFVYSQEYINANGEPSLVIRKVLNVKYSVDTLIERKFCTYKTAAFIIDKVRRGASIIWTGTMASGKSTGMNTFLDFFRHDKRGLVVQENDELFSKTHPLFMFQNIRPSEDGKFTYDLSYLTRFALLMDIDILVNGEIKGPEAEQYVDGVSRNIICWTSVHSTGARAGLDQIASLAVTEKRNKQECKRVLAEGTDFVIFIDKFQILEIGAVKGWDEKKNDYILELVPIEIPKKKYNTTKYKNLVRK